MADNKDMKYVGYKGYLAILASIIVLVGIIAALALTSVGQAITYAALNADTVNKVADLQADYNAKFELVSQE